MMPKNTENIIITKASGKNVEFDESKLRRSLEHSGANKQIVEQVLKEIQAIIYNGISTKEIYSNAFELLRKHSRPYAGRYKLKRAIMEFGPTGFPFEKFVGEILRCQGFNTKVGVIVKGQCVNHEVDVVAEKDNLHYMIECKFHADISRHCNVKVPLYIHSRFKDVEKSWLKLKGHVDKFHQGWIYTNTRFTTDAIKYGSCAGITLIGWDYPKNNSLKYQVDKYGLHPITSLVTLTKREKQILLNEGTVLCRSLCEYPGKLDSLELSEHRKQKVMEDAKELCNI